MKNFFRASGLVIIAIIFTTVACLIVLSSQYNEEQRQSVTQDANQFVGVGREAVRILTIKYSDRLAQLIENQFMQTESELSQGVRFEGAALVTQVAGGWKIVWSRYKNPEVTSELLQDQVGSWPMEGVGATETRWVQLKLPQGKTLQAFIMNVQSGSDTVQRGIGILPQTAFADVVTSFKSKPERLFIIDGAGYSYSFPEPQYVGTAFDSHTLVQHVVKNAAISFSGIFKDFGGQTVIGSYARVPDTNLFIAYTKPHVSASNFLSYFYFHSILVVLGCGLIFVLVAYWLRMGEIKNIEVLKENINLEKKRAADIPTEAAVLNKVSESQFNKAIIQLFNRPIVACVGFAQMLVSEVKSSSGQDRLRKIDKELRQMKDILQDFSEHEKIFDSQLEVVSINETIEQLLMSLRKNISKSNIQLEENIKSMTSVKGHFTWVKESLRALLIYSLVRLQSPASQNQPQRKIKVDLENVGGLAKIKITASGVHLLSDESKNIFKPFRFVNQEHAFNGLELLLARSHIEQQNGHLQFEVNGSNAFSFSVHLPSIHKISMDENKTTDVTPAISKSEIFVPSITMGVKSKTEPTPQTKVSRRPAANDTEKIDPELLKKAVPSDASTKLPPMPVHGADTVTDFKKIEFPTEKIELGLETKTDVDVRENSVSGVFIRKPKVRKED